MKCTMRASGRLTYRAICFYILVAITLLCLCSCGNRQVQPDWKKEYMPLVDAWELEKGEDVLGYELYIPGR